MKGYSLQERRKVQVLMRTFTDSLISGTARQQKRQQQAGNKSYEKEEKVGCTNSFNMYRKLAQYGSALADL